MHLENKYYMFYVTYNLAIYYYHCFACVLGNELKLGRCISAVMLGFQSTDDTVKYSIYVQRRGDKENFF